MIFYIHIQSKRYFFFVGENTNKGEEHCIYSLQPKKVTPANVGVSTNIDNTRNAIEVDYTLATAGLLFVGENTNKGGEYHYSSWRRTPYLLALYSCKLMFIH